MLENGTQDFGIVVDGAIEIEEGLFNG